MEEKTTPKKKENKAEEITKLKEENEKLIAQAEEFKDKWMRNVAEFDNYKKRNAKVYSDAFNDGKTDVILKILPIGDNLELALSMELDEKTAEGLKLLKRKFDEVLKSMDIEEIDPTGQPFDPNVAEAVMQVEKSEGQESDVVAQVFQKGYKIKDKIIRYARVSVTK